MPVSVAETNVQPESYGQQMIGNVRGFFSGVWFDFGQLQNSLAVRRLRARDDGSFVKHHRAVDFHKWVAGCYILSASKEVTKRGVKLVTRAGFTVTGRSKVQLKPGDEEAEAEAEVEVEEEVKKKRGDLLAASRAKKSLQLFGYWIAVLVAENSKRSHS